jgi:hypothetical protein
MNTRPVYAWARSACRSLLRRLLGCDCHTGVSAADLAALKPADAPPPDPEWAPLAEPADAAIDALWKVPPVLRGRRWYDAVNYLRWVKARALAAVRDPGCEDQSEPSSTPPQPRALEALLAQRAEMLRQQGEAHRIASKWIEETQKTPPDSGESQ